MCIRDSVWTPLKKGMADLKKLFAVARKAGYDGTFSIEDFSHDEATPDKLRENIAYLKALAASAQAPAPEQEESAFEDVYKRQVVLRLPVEPQPAHPAVPVFRNHRFHGPCVVPAQKFSRFLRTHEDHTDPYRTVTQKHQTIRKYDH